MCEPRRFTLFSLTIALSVADNLISPQDRGKNQQNAMGDGREHRKSTVSSTARLLLYTVRDSADAFPPLKSVAGGLCSILENYEVLFTSHTSLKPHRLESFQRAQGNKQAIESLAPRVKSLAELLCIPVSEGDTKEELRRNKLEQ